MVIQFELIVNLNTKVVKTTDDLNIIVIYFNRWQSTLLPEMFVLCILHVNLRTIPSILPPKSSSDTTATQR